MLSTAVEYSPVRAASRLFHILHLDFLWSNTEVTLLPDLHTPGLYRNHQPLEEIPGEDPAHEPVGGKAPAIGLTPARQAKEAQYLWGSIVEQFTDCRIALDQHGRWPV